MKNECEGAVGQRWYGSAAAVLILGASVLAASCGGTATTQTNPLDPGGGQLDGGVPDAPASAHDAGGNAPDSPAVGDGCVGSGCASPTPGDANTSDTPAVPSPCANSLDCGIGQVCDPTAKRCVACVIDADCAAAEHCASNVCRPGCSSDKDCAKFGLLCDMRVKYCVDCLSQAECPQAEYCQAGKCVPDVCAAGTSDCSKNAIVTCNADGSGTLAPVPCSTGQSCQHQGNSAACVAWVCSPSVRGCQTGEQVVTCSADGLIAQVTEDCGAKGQVCVAAACSPVVCAAGTQFCSGKELRRCSAKGDTSTLSQTCTMTQFCNDAADRCDPQICTPLQPVCNVAVATTCNADGSGYTPGGIDCASSGQACVQGACKNVICTPNTRFCSGATVQQCSADGTSSSPSTTCTSSQYCDAASATCKAQICMPGLPACNVNLATTCNADGSGYTGPSIDCTLTSQKCFAGVCTNKFTFSTSQIIDGKTVTCSSVTETGTYTQCSDLKVDGLYMPNGITCGPMWSTSNSLYSNTQGFCQSLTGSTMFEAYYVCSVDTLRATWKNHVWGTFTDNGYTQHVRCYY